MTDARTMPTIYLAEKLGIMARIGKRLDALSDIDVTDRDLDELLLQAENVRREIAQWRGEGPGSTVVLAARSDDRQCGARAWNLRPTEDPAVQDARPLIHWWYCTVLRGHESTRHVAHDVYGKPLAMWADGNHEATPL